MQHQHEQVYLISGQTQIEAERKAKNVSLVVDHGSPALGRRMPSIVGGLVYRGSADPWLQGKYIYMYGSAAEVQVGSHHYTTGRIPGVRCSGSSPLACRGIDGRVFSLGEDNGKDAFVLVHPDLCERAPEPETNWFLWSIAAALLFAFYRIYTVLLAGNTGGGASVTCCSCGDCFGTNSYTVHQA